MQEILKNKMLIGLVFVLIVGGFMYRSFSSDAPLDVDSASVVGQDLIQLSDDLSRATLSQEVFSMNAYTQLVDFTVPAPAQSFGRTNPFDILGRD